MNHNSLMGHEVPEEALPEPFNIRKQEPSARSIDRVSDVTASLSETSSKDRSQQLAAASHFPVTFRRHFSQKARSDEAEKPRKSLKLSSLEDATSYRVTSSVSETPRKEPCDSVLNTSAKFVSTPANMSATPGLCPAKRSYMSPKNEKLIRWPPRTGSKFDSLMKEVKALDLNGSPVDNDVPDILPQNRLQSEGRDPAISQSKRRQQMIVCLQKLFDKIHVVFQSLGRSAITKEELLHKLVSSHLDIVHRREVEEQLNLLLDLAPDWISEKLTSGGDLLLRIYKVSSPESFASHLEEAI